MRYTEMKYSGFSDIGEIPAHWPVVRIKHQYTVICGATPSDNPENWNGEIAWIGPADMSDFGKIKNGKRTISQIGYESCGTHKLPKGSVILSTRAPIGKIQIAGEEVCTNQGCKSMVKRYDKDSSDYLAYFLFSIKERLEVSGTGTTFKELSTINLKNMPLLLPSSSEQATIAAYLNEKCAAIDEIIAQAKATIEEYKAWKASVIFEAVTRGLDPNAEMRNSGVDWIGKIPKHWKVEKLKYTLSCPLQYGANSAGCVFSPDLPRYIRITDITSDNRLNLEKPLSLSWDEASEYLLQDNDILLARSGATVGKAFLYKKEYGVSAFAGYLIRATVNSSHASPKFIYYTTLGSGYEQWKESIAVHATISNIGANKYANYQLPVPPLAEQETIVTYLDKQCATIDEIIAEKQALVDDLETYKKSLIFETVTGKRSVC